MTKRRVGILISGGGSNMVSLVRSMGPDHGATPALVLSNNPDAHGLGKARDLGVATATVRHEDFQTREDFEAEISRALDRFDIDLLCLAGFMRILTPGFTRRWAGKCLNIHPSLLPAFRGLDTHARALAAGVKEHGCTVHEVVADLDAGPILGQARIPVLPDDTPETLAARVIVQEHKLYPAVLRRFAENDRTPLFLDAS